MAHFGKTIFLSFLLTGILALALKTNIPPLISGVLFLLASFLSTLAIGAQSFTLARLPFLFIGGFIFFLTLIRANAGFSDNLFLVLSFTAFSAVFTSSVHFSFLHKNLPNISQKDYQKFIKKYINARNLFFSFLFLTAFFWYADAFVVYSVLGLPFYLALGIIFLTTLILTSFILGIYEAASVKKKSYFPRVFYSWTTGLVISEMSWIAGFWPLGYLTVAIIITIIYYAIVMILKEYLFSANFKLASALREIIFSGAVIVIIFYFTKWLPL